jgi:MauM/NapG family ferredoxin protein
MKKLLTWSNGRRIRQAVQILTFVLYVYLLFAALQRRAAFFLADLFFRLDPLAALGALLAGRAWIPRLALALTTLVLTLLLGRVWCGWICPLGTLLEWIRFPAASKRTRDFSPNWRRAKYVLLAAILAMALLGNLSLFIFDPLTILTRGMTTVILPAINHGITTIERALYDLSILTPVVDGVEKLLRGPVLPVEQPVFGQNVFIAVFLLGIFALNAWADRFWCRYLCPLGALLGLLSKVALLRPIVSSSCSRCAQCVSACHLDAIDTDKGYDIVPAECTVCLDCLAACPESGVGFRLPVDRTGWHWRPAPIHSYDPTRRQMLAGLATGAASVGVLRTSTQTKRLHPQLIRPPGVEDEGEFLALCLRCSQCLKVCPTSGLQPVLFEAGLEGMWTPRLVSRLGYCDFSCNACGQVCPSGAIPPLDLASKREFFIGVAVIDRDLCLPWAHGIPCIVCEEVCPVSGKAVRLEEVTVTDAKGEQVDVQRPYVLKDDCIGCGICEYQCPVEGETPIQIYRR